MTLWRPRREDIPALLSIAALPLLLALPQLLGLLHDDPRLYTGDLAQNLRGGLLPGAAHLDPNIGFTTQALGRLAALDWLHGVIPWWNPYSGVGLPLAAEYQPAAFSPLTLFLLLPNGMVWRHLALQILAGWGSYAWLRQLGLGRLAAFTGGVLFAQNGALSWFGDAPAGPVPFFPWVLLGVERVFAKAARQEPGGWRILALALALMLLAGFPEIAYICGLFVLAWVAVRATQYEARLRFGIAWRLLLGGAVGLALAAPQILAFFEFLPVAILGQHGTTSVHRALAARAAISGLLAPYAYGPILYNTQTGWDPLNKTWSGVGGYIDLVELVLAAYGFWQRRDRLSWMLLGWIALVLAKVYGIPPLAGGWNLIPGVALSVFCRYATPTWELATFTLAAFGVEALSRQASQRRGPLLAAAAVLAVGLCALLGAAFWQWPHDLRVWMPLSIAWATFTGGLVVVLMAYAPHRWRAQAVAAVLTLDAGLMFTIPTLSDPRGGTIDNAAIAFLQHNLGLERFHTLGPIAPNYGAYYGIASIGYVALPSTALWANWVADNLEHGASPMNFSGNRLLPPDQPSAAQQLRQYLAAYEETGVKYVLAPAGANPFVEVIAPPVSTQNVRGLPLAPGQSAQGIIALGVLAHPVQINGLGVLIANYAHTSTGTLSATLCVAGQCASGSVGLAGSPDNAILPIALSPPLTLASNATVTFRIFHPTGSNAVALWAFPTSANQSLIAPGGAQPGFGLKLELQEVPSSPLPQRVYADRLMDIYQLPAPKPYFETLGSACALYPQSRTRVLADCPSPALLVRRELFFPGWRAHINGQRAPILMQGGLFQSLNLPAGRSVITFAYAPPHILWAWLLALLGVLAFLIPAFRRRDGAKA